MKPRRFRWMAITLLLGLAMGVLPWLASLPASGQAGTEWRVWMKVSPCSGRTDWVSVAKENPSGGGSVFEVFPGSRVWPTFAAAIAEASSLRSSSLFSKYCCRDYSVWQNNQTGKLSVVQGKFGNAGFGWRFVKGELCCDEAFAEAGLAGSCGGGAESNTALNGTNLTFYARSSAQQCQADCAGNAKCKGFTWIHAGTYNPNDAAMCYLLSAVTGRSSVAGHTSAVKNTDGGFGGGGGTVKSGGGSGKSGPTTRAAGRLQLVEITQDPKCSTWNNTTSCNPNGGQVSWYNTNYQWNSPPQQVGPEGFTINMSVSQQNSPDRSVATGLGMSGGGFELDPANPTIPIGAPKQPMSGSLSVKVKPPKNPSGDYYLKIGVYWGPGFSYHYRVVR
jgi:hypothetical protein